MSRLIRNIMPAATVFIGDRRLDTELEKLAEQELGRVFPFVSVITGVDGAKFIPIQEVFKIAAAYEQELRGEREAGQTQGYQTGLAQGRAEGKAQAEQVLQQFNQAIADAIAQREILLNEAREKILELVIQISRKVTFDAITVDPESTLMMIRGVIEGLVDRSKLKIKVNPDHLPIVEQNIDRFVPGSATLKEVTIEADSRVRYGGCLIETPTGDIDARLESQFEVLEEAIFSQEEQG